MRLGLVVKIILGVVALAVAGLALFLLTFDVNSYKPRLAALVREETGRELDLKGQVDFRIFPQPALVVRDARFQNASWGSRPDMAILGELALAVEIWPLLTGGDMVITLIAVKDLDLLLETDGKGHANWALGQAAPQGKPAAPPQAAEERGELRIPALEKLQLANVRLTYRDGRSGEETRFDLKTFEAAIRKGDRMQVAAEALFREETIKLSGALGALPVLLQSKTPYPVELDIAVAGLQAKVAGTVSDLHSAPKLDLRLAAEADDLAKLNRLLQTDLPAGRNVKLATTLSGDPAREFSLGGLDLDYGKTKLAGEAKVNLTGPRPRIAAKLSSPLIDLEELQGPKAPAPKPAKSGAGRRLFPDDPLPLEALGAADLDLTLSIAEFRGADLTLGNLLAEARLVDRQLAVKPFSLAAFDGTLEGSLSLDARGQRPTVALDLVGRQLDLNKAARQASDKDVIEGRADLKINLRGSGNSLRRIMASLGGSTEVIVGEGRVKNRWLELLSADLLRLITPWSSKDDSKLNCFVSRFDLAGGVMTSRALLGDTAGATLVGEGNINLGSEQIAMKFTPRPKEISLMSLAAPILVNGWLGDPSFQPDAAAMAMGAAGAVGGVVLGGGLIGGLIGMVAGGGASAAETGNPCLAALARASRPAAADRRQAPPAQRSQQQPPPAQQEPTSPFGAMREGLRNLFGPRQ